MSKQVVFWPKHKPETTLHSIVMDGVARDFTNEQIIEETNGIADAEMIALYKKSFCDDMKKYYESVEK